MIDDKKLTPAERSILTIQRLGTLAHLTIFFWSLGMVLLTPPRWMPLAAGACLVVIRILYSTTFRRLFRARRLVFFAILVLPYLFRAGEESFTVAGLSISVDGLMTGFLMFLRIVVVLAAVDGLSRSVDIMEVSGLLERIGLKGMGFSMGVAMNLLPSIRQSAANAWNSLWMRGGFRHQRWRGLVLLVVTVMSNALRRGEEIALSAEARAFSPERSRQYPLRTGEWDRWVWVIALGSIVFVLLLK